MKQPCVLEPEGLNYTLDIGRRTRGSICVREGKLIVRLPYGTGIKQAEELLRNNMYWVSKKLAEYKPLLRLPESFSGGEEFMLLGEKRRLAVEISPVYEEPLLADGSLTVYISENMNQKDTQRLFWEYTVKLCTERVQRAFDEYSPKLELYPKKITLRRMTSRWGSCSSNGNISINTDVICFGQPCIDYVVIHELCHLKHMDHSADFWALVSQCCPEYKRLREIMKH